MINIDTTDITCAYAVAHSVPDSAASTMPLPSTQVFIDGQPCCDWVVQYITSKGPIDYRTCKLTPVEPMPLELVASFTSITRATSIVIAQPLTLSSGESAWLPLMVGKVSLDGRQREATRDSMTLTLIDAWSQSLDTPINFDHADDLPDTIGGMLDAIATACEMNIDVAAIPTATLTQPLGPVTQQGTLGNRLKQVTEVADLVGRQVFTELRSGAVDVSIHILPTSLTPRLPLQERHFVNGHHRLPAWREQRATCRPVRFTAVARGETVEATLMMTPGWAVTDQNLADAQYARSTSDDFRAVAHVFRLWVLNEDGTFAGPSFNLADLFDTHVESIKQPVPIEPCLTLDDAGQPWQAIVEVSINAGTTWREYAGRYTLLTDRAGVLLEDDELGADWLEAVRAGDARLRITGTLRCPIDRQLVRWRGNPFAGPFDSVQQDVGRRFDIRRVDSSSRFYQSVNAGLISADQADGTAALEAWGIDQLKRHPANDHRLRLTLSTLMLGLRIGDRIELPPSFDAAHQQHARITALQWHWPKQLTQLTIEAIN